MTSHPRLSRLGRLALLVPMPCLAQGLPSLQGYTGLLNTPNALVAPEGAVDLQYTNQPDVRWRKGAELANNDMFTIGLFPYMEITGRQAVVHNSIFGGLDGLQANFKLQIPFLPEWMPKLALGAQDVAGGVATSYYKTRYGVLSKDLGPLRLSLGEGTGPARMKGMFGGGELTLSRWMQLVGEYDTTDKNVGAKFLTPAGLLPSGMVLGLTTKYSLEFQPRHINVAFSLRVPLSEGPFPKSNTPSSSPTASLAPCPETEPPTSAPFPKDHGNPGPGKGPASSVTRAIPANTDQLAIAHDLQALGFENVRVGSRGRTLVVEYENNRYNHNETDGLGLVMGTVVTEATGGFDTFLISVRRQNLGMLEVEGPIRLFRDFFHSWDRPDGHVIASLAIRQAESFGAPEGVTWSGDVVNAGWFNSRLLLGPGLNTAIGTEVGAFNYRLSLIPDLQMSLWRGAVLNYRWDLPVSWSQNYRYGQPFGNLGTNYSLDRIWVSQVIPLAKGLMAQVGGGRYDVQTNGAMGDLMWNPGSGANRFTLKVAQFKVSGAQDLRVALGAYRYDYAPLETSLEATGGWFYNNDKGFRLDLKRYFGDTAFAIWYSRTDVNKVGFTLGLPLTPRRDMRPGLLQVRGTELFQDGMGVHINAPAYQGYLAPNSAVIPVTTYNLERSYYNIGRLNEDYLREHLPRLREAYHLFKLIPRH